MFYVMYRWAPYAVGEAKLCFGIVSLNQAMRTVRTLNDTLSDEELRDGCCYWFIPAEELR